MQATKSTKEKSELQFPGKAVSLSEYHNNIARAERSDNMAFAEFKNHISKW